MRVRPRVGGGGVAGEEAAHARQLAAERDAACQALQKKLDAAAKKADAVC